MKMNSFWLICLFGLLAAWTPLLHAQNDVLADFSCDPASCIDSTPAVYQGSASVLWGGDCFPSSGGSFGFGYTSTAIIGTSGKCSSLYKANVTVYTTSKGAAYPSCGYTDGVKAYADIYTYLGDWVTGRTFQLWCDNVNDRVGSGTGSVPC